MELQEKKWYTVKVQSNREKSVSEKLKSEMMRDFKEDINVLIPTQTLSFLKQGKVKQREQIMYPGYIFVETVSIDKILHFVKIIQGLSSVLKDPQGNPIQLRNSEIEKMTGEVQKRQSVNVGVYVVGEEVNITNGPFANFRGKIKNIDYDKEKAKIEVVIFGRPTIVDLTLADISK